MSSQFVERFLQHGRDRSTEKLPGWWTDFRAAAAGRLESIDVPGRRDEEWRFIKLNPLTDKAWSSEKEAELSLGPDALKENLLEESEKLTLVFVNGQYAPQLSRIEGLPEGAVVTNWKGLVENHDPEVVRDYVGANDFWKDDLFYNLNGANFEDGAVILVPRNTVVETPIHLLFVSSGEEGEFAAHPRNIIVAGESAEVTVVEEYVGRGSGAYFNNVVDEVSVGANANVSHFKVQRDSTEAFHVARNIVSLARDSRYISTAINLGAALSRNDSYASYEGQNIDCTLDGLAYIRGNQVSDTHTAIDHALPNSRSYQLHKVIVDEQAHSVFNGKIFVRQDAQQTRSEQLNQNLILSKRAHVDTKPQLEILADDVICSHGATVGQLEEEQFFYLMSRGVNRDHARALLTYAFAAEVLETISVDSLRLALESEVLEATAG